MRVLFVTPECAPLTKTGGLGDVSAALPAALRRAGTDVRILLPLYPALPAAASQPGFPGELRAAGARRARAAGAKLRARGPRVLRPALLPQGRHRACGRDRDREPGLCARDPHRGARLRPARAARAP